MNPPLACINPTPLLFYKIGTNSKSDSETWKKASHQFVELAESNTLIYNILQFDQYPRLTILLNIFRFSAKISKINLKLKKAFHQFIELVESNPLIYNTLHFD